MSWIRIEDTIVDHQKFLRAGPTASWLFICGLSYCARHLTDGVIPRIALPLLGVPKPQASVLRLVAVGLWEEVADGYRIHDYHDYQPTKDEVAERRAERSAAGRRGGRLSGMTRRREQPVTKQQLEAIASPTDEAVASSSDRQQLEPHPIPSHPIEIVPNGTLSQRAREPLHERRNGRIQNHGDPMPLWDWQFAKFRDALRPKFGEAAWTQVMAWVDRVGDELNAAGKPVDVSDPVKWWDARYAADWAAGSVDDLAAFRALGKAGAS